METMLRSGSAPADAGSPKTIADDRIEGAAAIGQFIDDTMTEREARTRLARGDYPHWREGRTFVASKAALLAHWRQKTTQTPPGQPEPAAPQNKSTRRGYRPDAAPPPRSARRGGKLQRRADGEGRA